MIYHRDVITGPEIVYIFQAALLIIIVFIASHALLSQSFEPTSLLVLVFGVLALQLANAVLISLFDQFVITEFSALVFVAPIVEELSKFMVVIYLVMRSDNDIYTKTHHGFLVGLGFGIGELIGYAIVVGPHTSLYRSILLPFGHPLLTAILANLLAIIARKDFEPTQQSINVLLSIVLVIGLHVFWNLLSIQSLHWLTIPVLLNSLIFVKLLRNDHGS